MQVKEDLQAALQQAALTKIIQEEHETETWLNREYAEQDIGRELRNIAKRKHMELMEYQEKHTKRQENWQSRR